jgi:hypothetical protein
MTTPVPPPWRGSSHLRTPFTSPVAGVSWGFAPPTPVLSCPVSAPVFAACRLSGFPPVALVGSLRPRPHSHGPSTLSAIRSFGPNNDGAAKNSTGQQSCALSLGVSSMAFV